VYHSALKRLNSAILLVADSSLDSIVEVTCRKVGLDAGIERVLVSVEPSAQLFQLMRRQRANRAFDVLDRVQTHARTPSLLYPNSSPIEAMPLPFPKPLVLGIAGCSGSGKTTLARELATQLEATLFPLDLYYRDLSQFPLDSRHKRNFDHPDSLESELIIEHVRGLADGQTIQRPVYDFKTHSRVADAFDAIAPARVVIVEGILALYYAELVACFGFSIYVNAPHDVCLARRIHRDVRERGRTADSVREQFNATARPMADLYVVPSAARASLIVEGTDSIDWSVEQILQRLHRAGLMSAL
jgi:uridine kinase